MPNAIGNVQNVGVLAHYMMLDKIKTFAEANGYTILRYDTTVANRELIMKAPGYSGTDSIYIGFKTYQDVSADYYNLTVATFTGYVAGNTFAGQPGALLSGIPAHNNRIDYWISLNPQRIAIALKVGTPVYVSGYAGKYFVYATPSQYPYPVVCAGMLNGETPTRFSNTNYFMPYKGDSYSSLCNMRFWFNSGLYLKPNAWPWSSTIYAATSSDYQLRDTGGNYQLLPVTLWDNQGVYGELDGIYFISGFNNTVENTIVISGVTYVVIQDVSRTGFIDYYALRMDA